MTDHKLVWFSLRFVNRPSLAGYWKFNTSLLEIGDFWERLETLIQRTLVGAVTGNKWWESLKYRIRDFTIKYDQQFKLDRTKKAMCLEDRLSRVVKRGDSLGVDLAKREPSERYKGFVVRARLNRVSYEAVKCNAFEREEEIRRFPHRYIEFVKSPDGNALWSNCEMRDAFREYFPDRFARCPDFPVQEFRSYLANFPHLEEEEAASCKSLVTECEVHDALEQVGLNKSPGLDGLPNQVYLRMSHIFVPIQTDLFNHWFAHGAIPGSINKGMITLLKATGMFGRT